MRREERDNESKGLRGGGEGGNAVVPMGNIFQSRLTFSKLKW